MPYGWILFTLLICWVFQIWFNSIQVQKFNRRFTELRKMGSISAVGIAGKYWQGRVFAVLVSNETGTITAAEYLSGITIFSSLQQQPLLVGKHINYITSESNPEPEKIRKKTWNAFIHAANFIRQKLNEETELPGGKTSLAGGLVP